jgi:outer membrane lipoprotein-sorting protein
MRLKTISAFFAFVIAFAAAGVAQLIATAAKTPSKAESAPAKVSAESKPAAAAPKATAPAPSDKELLESVLKKMDAAAGSFRTTEADFQWDQFTRVIGSTDTQTGKIYFRRNGKNIEMFADVQAVNGKPEGKEVLFTDSKLRLYEPKMDRVTVYDTGKNRADFESFLVLGFGGRGHDLANSFDVKYAGIEAVNGIKASKLELTPKTEKARKVFSNIELWIDDARGISVQQKFIEAESGDYRLAKYSGIKINEKISDDDFKLKTTGKTKVVNAPSGL